MRAVVYQQFGEPSEVLGLATVEAPQPRPGEVLVRMLASPINPSDLMTIRGEYAKTPELPATPGYEGVGVVESTGGGLYAGFLKGQRVAAMNAGGGNWAERVCIPAQSAIPLAKDLPIEQAAAFFVNPATAYVMTRKVLAVPKGAWLLQTAAGSTLGRMVIRLGREFGFRTLNVVRREEQVEELTALGGDAVVAFDPERDHTEDFVERVRGLTEGEGVRYAIDPVGGGTASAVVPCLGTEGRLLVFGTLSGGPLIFDPRELMTPGAKVEGFWLTNYMASLGMLSKLGLVRTITGLLRKGVLASEIGRTFPLEEIGAAVVEAERPGRGGKTLLEISKEA